MDRIYGYMTQHRELALESYAIKSTVTKIMILVASLVVVSKGVGGYKAEEMMRVMLQPRIVVHELQLIL